MWLFWRCWLLLSLYVSTHFYNCVCACVCANIYIFFFFFLFLIAPSSFFLSHCYFDAMIHLSLREQSRFFDKFIIFCFALRFKIFVIDWCCVFRILNFSITFFALQRYSWNFQKFSYEVASTHRIKYWNLFFLIYLLSISFIFHFFSFLMKMNCDFEFSSREYHDFKNDTWNMLWITLYFFKNFKRHVCEFTFSITIKDFNWRWLIFFLKRKVRILMFRKNTFSFSLKTIDLWCAS